MIEINLFIILGTTIICLLVFILVIYFFQKKGYNNIECLLDFNNINRVTLGQNS